MKYGPEVLLEKLEKESKKMSANRIPKIIHYCWFSGEPVTPFIQSCMDTWKAIMPDYNLKLWDAQSFDFDSVPFVKETYKKKKWAFVADYIRLYAVYTEGGIYLDSDVMVMKPFDSFLQYSFFTSHEFHPGNFTEKEKRKLSENGIVINPNEYVSGLNIQAAIFGGEKGNPYLKDCLDFYHRMASIKNIEGKEFESFIIGPFISKVAEKYGYRYIPDRQHLNQNMVIFEPEYFVGNSLFLTKNSYAIHLINGSWREKSAYKTFMHYLRNYHKYLFGFFNFCEKVIRKIKRMTTRVNCI